MTESRDRLLRLSAGRRSRGVGATLLVMLAVVLALLPFWVAFQDALTRVVMSVGGYRVLQEFIVPYELQIVGRVLTTLGMPLRVGAAYLEWERAGGGNEVIYLAWNCVGWQTVVLFGITLLTGLSGGHSKGARVEVLLIGVLGTYLINLVRLLLVVVVYFWLGRAVGTVFHDYFSNVLTFGWLFVFWWFSYRFVLKGGD